MRTGDDNQQTKEPEIISRDSSSGGETECDRQVYHV